VSFADARAAVDHLKRAAAAADDRRAAARSPAAAGPINRSLMAIRKDLLPWLVGRGAGGVRTSTYATQVQAVAAARASAAAGDRAALETALARMLGPGANASREAYREERLYAYTSGDWSSLFAQRPQPMAAAVYDLYTRVKSGGAPPQSETSALAALETEARGRLSDALFLIAGKLDAAARALEAAPLP
jgi:hypothetical protein